MGVVGAWLPSLCEALQPQHTCLSKESTASCHRSSHRERGQHWVWQSPSTARAAPEATSYGFHTPTHPSPGRAPIPGGLVQGLGEAWQAQSPQTAALACD